MQENTSYLFIKQLEAIKKANRFREKKLYENKLDFASNDYLNLSNKKSLLKKAYKSLKKSPHSPKASLLVNGYQKLHKKLEDKLAKMHNFQACTLVGSGFLANLALFDTLIRKKDIVFIDEYYHASGRFICDKLPNAIYFKHNDIDDLKKKIEEFESKAGFEGEVFIAIEGIYSMDGDVASKQIALLARSKDYFLIVDEAHSIGVLGENLLGFFEFYNLKIRSKDIILGTLSKAYASYGAYILANENVIKFLCTKARSIIYTTALSLLDVALALQNIKYIKKHKKQIKKQIAKKQDLVKKYFNINLDSLILPLIFNDASVILSLQEKILKKGAIIGAIRAPSVPTSRLRITLRNTPKSLEDLFSFIIKAKKFDKIQESSN